jgi:hypothetical protein
MKQGKQQVTRRKSKSKTGDASGRRLGKEWIVVERYEGLLWLSDLRDCNQVHCLGEALLLKDSNDCTQIFDMRLIVGL